MIKDIEGWFWDKVEKTDSCWIWKGAKTRKGYGQTSRNYVIIRAHRLSYEMAFGEIPEGLTIDHLCRNHACVNPDHLEAVTLKENVLRGIGITAQNARKTHCPHGHPYSEDNTRHYRGERHCNTCKQIYNHAYYKTHYKREYPIQEG